MQMDSSVQGETQRTRGNETKEKIHPSWRNPRGKSPKAEKTKKRKRKRQKSRYCWGRRRNRRMNIRNQIRNGGKGHRYRVRRTRTETPARPDETGISLVWTEDRMSRRSSEERFTIWLTEYEATFEGPEKKNEKFMQEEKELVENRNVRHHSLVFIFPSV